VITTKDFLETLRASGFLVTNPEGRRRARMGRAPRFKAISAFCREQTRKTTDIPVLPWCVVLHIDELPLVTRAEEDQRAMGIDRECSVSLQRLALRILNPEGGRELHAGRAGFGAWGRLRGVLDTMALFSSETIYTGCGLNQRETLEMFT